MELMNDIPECKLSDNEKIQFNFMSINGLSQCLEKYVDWYHDCPEVYENYICYLLFSCLVKKKGEHLITDIFLLKKIVSILPKKILQYIYENFRLPYDPYLLSSIVRNKDYSAVEYLVKVINLSKIFSEDHSNVINYFIDAKVINESFKCFGNIPYNYKDDYKDYLEINVDKMFRLIYIDNMMKYNIPLVFTNSEDQQIKQNMEYVTSFLASFHIFLDNNSKLQFMTVDAIIIENNVSHRKNIRLYDIYENRISVQNVDEIRSHLNIDKEFVVSKGNYKITIYRVDKVLSVGYNFIVYDASYLVNSIHKVMTIIY